MDERLNLALKPEVSSSVKKKPKKQKEYVYLFFLDRQLDIVWLNQSFINLCKQNLSFFVGRSVYEFFQQAHIRILIEKAKNSERYLGSSGLLTIHIPRFEISLDNCRWSFIPYQNEKRWVTGYFLVIVTH